MEAGAGDATDVAVVGLWLAMEVLIPVRSAYAYVCFPRYPCYDDLICFCI